MHKFMTKFKSIKLNYSNIAGNVRERDKQVYMKMCIELPLKERKRLSRLIKILDS